jgi:hypothetical protein
MALTYLEDYIEFLYGSLNKNGESASVLYKHLTSNDTIKLATYDRSPVTSMGSFCAKTRIQKEQECLTDRQVDLANKIVYKYKRQLATIGVTLPDESVGLPLRHGVRKIDRSKYLNHNVDEKTVTLKFPYDPAKISSLHNYVQNSAGNVEWDNTKKEWKMDLTEGNLLKILELFKSEDLKISETLEPYIVDLYSATPRNLPSLYLRDNAMRLENCHSSVEDYLISKNWNQDDVSNLSYWASIAAGLALRIDESVKEELSKHYTNSVVDIITQRKVTLPSNNQPDGAWYNTLLEANRALNKNPWILHLNWWTNKTDWSPFSNLIRPLTKDRNQFRVSKEFADLLTSNQNAIVIVDSVVGRDAVRNFIENNSIKIVYISDIGHDQ